MVSLGLADPRRHTPFQKHLDKDFSDMYTSFKEEDPPAMPQHPLPNTAVSQTVFYLLALGTTYASITADLVVLAFFFLLRIGEYTHSPPPRDRKKRTVPLRRVDITLWQGEYMIPRDSPLESLLQADGISLHLANQKNGHRNCTIFHSSTGVIGLDPVTAGARLLHHTRFGTDTTPIGSFQKPNGRVSRVSPAKILQAVRKGAQLDGMPARGFDMKRIGSHSLRSGGAMNLKLQGHDKDIIQTIGRWSSDTYRRYIHSQIAHLTAGIAQTMARPLSFFNIDRRPNI